MESAIEVLVLTEKEEAIPFYASKEAAGADVRASLDKPLVIGAGKWALIPTGLAFEIPTGYEIQVRPRSGLALKSGITVLNTPGTIDSDYRGQLAVILMNHSHNDFVVEPNMRIAQIVLSPVVQARFVRADALCSTERGSKGFGSTGLIG